MTTAWRWAGACSIGTSHVRSGIECQDRASCITLTVGDQSYLCAVVADGAGTAVEAARGAAIVCAGFQRRALSFLRAGGHLAAVNSEIISDWLDEIRERIVARSVQATLRPRDFAATLVGVVVGPAGALVVHIGDGAVVLRHSVEQNWIVPSWPYHGEYASVTRFITDDPSPAANTIYVDGAFDRAVVFSDGMERLMLDFGIKEAPSDFFNRLSEPVANSPSNGRDRKLSQHLRTYLGGEKVCNATDDDKSLVIGVRA